MDLTLVVTLISAAATLAASTITPVPRATPSSAAAAVSASLAGQQQCVSFAWIANDKGSARGAITVPVQLDGKALRMQLDTGTDATSVYGHLAERAGWAKPGAETFRAHNLTIAGTVLDRSIVYVNTDMDEDASVQGTLGLPALAGKVAVIDYPGRRFCLFAEPDLPASISAAPFVRAMLRNSRMYIPVLAGEYSSDAIVFDTGSSELPLNVDLATWTRLTGRKSTEGAPVSYRGSAWGKPLIIPGAPSAASMKLGAIELGRHDVYTNPLQPTGFADWPVRTDGVLGNAPVWDGIVILDLTAKVRFAFIR